MIKTEKYKESVMALSLLCKHINHSIGTYESHYLTTDFQFMVVLSNGTLTFPLILAAEFNNKNIIHSREMLLEAAASFKPKTTKQRSYRTVLHDWKSLFSTNTI